MFKAKPMKSIQLHKQSNLNTHSYQAQRCRPRRPPPFLRHLQPPEFLLQLEKHRPMIVSFT
ncbi:unnamed protein product [Cuscuta epithymum]|uniref:Uncharacterized protein n=1 Tax=Cuscuta epithymum TaxID=186058 RepID=A0AAV0GBD4_9ASTE|nr:unnamed protein product [Cuscuta epithymum]CAH9145121.1 unnamed protein product [Cuscuta epithymum]